MKKIIMIWILVLFISLFISDFVEATPVCCLESDGYCSSNRDSVECVGGQGQIIDQGSCYNTDDTAKQEQCTQVGCVIPAAGTCIPSTLGRCKILTTDLSTPTLVPIERCGSYQYTSVEIGCCVNSDTNNCETVTSRTQCTGAFFDGTCSEGDVSSICNNCRPLEPTCTDDRTGIMERTTCGIGEYTSCGEGRKCTLDRNGNAECKISYCEVGETTTLKVLDLDNGRILTQDSTIRSEFLGSFNGEEVTRREDGESWCIVFGTEDGRTWDLYSKQDIIDDKDIRKKYSAGSRHHKYSCVDGEIVAVPGDLFRQTICFQNDETDFYLKGSEFEKFASCKRTGSSRELWNYVDKWEEIKKFMEGTGTLDTTSVGFRSSGGSRSTTLKTFVDARNALLDGKGVARLDPNSDGSGSCKLPYYPIGGYFYDDRILDEGAPPLQCGQCGGDSFDLNICGKDECYRAGDCGYKGGGAGRIALGCAEGAVIAEVLWLTLGSAGVHDYGGWTSIWTASTAQTAGSSLVNDPRFMQPSPSSFASSAGSPLGGTPSSVGTEIGVGTERTGSLFTTGPNGERILNTGINPVDKFAFEPEGGWRLGQGSSILNDRVSLITGVSSSGRGTEFVPRAVQGAFDDPKNIRIESNRDDPFWKSAVERVYQGSQVLNFVGTRVDSQGNTRFYLEDPRTTENPVYMVGDLENGGVNPIHLFSPPVDGSTSQGDEDEIS